MKIKIKTRKIKGSQLISKTQQKGGEIKNILVLCQRKEGPDTIKSIKFIEKYVKDFFSPDDIFNIEYLISNFLISVCFTFYLLRFNF